MAENVDPNAVQLDAAEAPQTVANARKPFKFSLLAALPLEVLVILMAGLACPADVLAVAMTCRALSDLVLDSDVVWTSVLRTYYSIHEGSHLACATAAIQLHAVGRRFPPTGPAAKWPVAKFLCAALSQALETHRTTSFALALRKFPSMPQAGQLLHATKAWLRDLVKLTAHPWPRGLQIDLLTLDTSKALQAFTKSNDSGIEALALSALANLLTMSDFTMFRALQAASSAPAPALKTRFKLGARAVLDSAASGAINRLTSVHPAVVKHASRALLNRAAATHYANEVMAPILVQPMRVFGAPGGALPTGDWKLWQFSPDGAQLKTSYLFCDRVPNPGVVLHGRRYTVAAHPLGRSYTLYGHQDPETRELSLLRVDPEAGDAEDIDEGIDEVDDSIVSWRDAAGAWGVAHGYLGPQLFRIEFGGHEEELMEYSKQLELQAASA